MVDLPTVPDRMVTTSAPTSSVSSRDIIGNTNLMAKAIGDVADAQMEIATRQAKEQAAEDLQQQKVTLNADGSVNVANPANSMIFGRAGENYNHAVQAGTIVQHSNVISEEMNGLHQKYPTDPAAFKTAADSWKAQYAKDHGGGIVGQAISQQADQVQTQHQMAIANTTGQLEVTNQQKSIVAGISDQKNVLQGLARQPGGTETPQFKAALEQMGASYQALTTNPLFKMPKDQADLEVKNFSNLLQGEAIVSHIDDTFTKKGKGDAQKALNESILQNPNLSEVDRNRLYSHGMARLQYLTADSKEKIDAGRKVVGELETNVANGTIKPTDPIIGMSIKQAQERGDPESANRILAATAVRMNLTGIQTLPQTVQAEVLGIKMPGAVNTAIPMEARALLDHIAGPESGGRYDVRYGGQRFAGFGDHPRVAEPITSGPDVGKTSSAAGRYQFIGSTWDQQRAKLGLKDFSPANQDAAAWDLAQTEYKRKTGTDLLTVLKSGDQAAISDVPGQLSGQWASLPGGRQPAGGGPAFVPNLAAADRELKLTPQEKGLYQGHLTNLTGQGGVDNADGSRSTVKALSVESDGKTYMIPTVYDGKIVSSDEAWKRAKGHLDDFPKYASQEEAKARYDKMHTFMEADTGSYKQSLVRPAPIAPAAAPGRPGFTYQDLQRNPFLGSAYVRTIAADESLRTQSATQAAAGVTKAVDNGFIPRAEDVALVNQTAQQYPEKFGPVAEAMNGRILGGALATLEQPQRDAVIAQYRDATNGQDQHHMNVAAAALDQYSKSEKNLTEHPFQEAATRGWIAPVAPIDPSQPASIPAALQQRVAASERIAAMNHTPAPPVLGKDEMPQLQGALEGPQGAQVLASIAGSLKPEDMHTLLEEKGFKDSVTGMQSSLDPMKMSTANAVVEQVWERNAALAEQSLKQPSIDKMQAWQALKGSFSKEELAKRLNMSDDPATLKTRKDAMTAAKEETEKLTAGDMAYKMGTGSWLLGGLTGNTPRGALDVPATANLPGGSLMAGALLNDYKATYVGMRAFGLDADKASVQAVERLKSTWGPSEAAGNQLMRLPPEHYNRPIEGAPNWIGEQLNDFVAGSQGPAIRQHPAVPGKGSSPRQSWSISGLVADARTESEVSNGQPPSYHVAIKRGSGEIDVLPDRITFDGAKYLARNEQKLRGKLENIQATRNATFTGMPQP